MVDVTFTEAVMFRMAMPSRSPAEELEAAVAFAKSSPFPDPQAALASLFAE